MQIMRHKHGVFCLRLFAHGELQLLHWLRWALLGVAAIKLLITCAACISAVRSRIVRSGTLVLVGVIWFAYVALILAVAHRFVGALPAFWQIVPSAIIVGVPILGLTFAPIALNWNRYGK